MTDREIYATVYAAAVQGVTACGRAVRMQIPGNIDCTLNEFANDCAQSAVRNAPKYQPTKLVEAMDDLIKVQGSYVDTSRMPTPMLEHYGMLIQAVERDRTSL